MSKKTVAPIKEKKIVATDFFALNTKEDIANFLQIPVHKLTYLLIHLPQEKRYIEFTIPKKNGTQRTIKAPNFYLKQIQRKLAELFNCVYWPKKYVHGFVKGRSIVSNAKKHCKQTYLLNIDLEDFFGSIHFGRIRGLFTSSPYSRPIDVANMLATICCCDFKLAQGAPTSPVISNMICRRLDAELVRFCAQHGATYSRFADDISISFSTTHIPAEIGQLVDGVFTLSKELESIIEIQNKFIINKSKVRLQTSRGRQVVTGLTTNKKVNVSRKYIRNLRAALRAWEKYGLEKFHKKYEEKYLKFRLPAKKVPPAEQVLKGKIDFLGMVRNSKEKDDEIYIELITRYHKLIRRDKSPMPTHGSKVYKYDVFLSHASEDKAAFTDGLCSALTKKGIIVWYDKTEIKAGESLRSKIDEGLKHSSYGIVVLSVAFFSKNWTSKELDGLYSLETEDGRSRIVPIWYKIDHSHVNNYSPTLAGRKAIAVDRVNYKDVVAEIARAIGKKC